MHREDNSLYFLYIEPRKEEKNTIAIDDVITKTIEQAIRVAPSGSSRYSKLDDLGTFFSDSAFRGMHTTDCDEMSTNRDYQLKTGHITNSLAPFYLRWYRHVIPTSEMKKLIVILKAYRDQVPENELQEFNRSLKALCVEFE